MAALLFVGNITTDADAFFLQRLFSAYGSVVDVQIVRNPLHATVALRHCDDADCAIAALHLRYYVAPNAAVLVMYHKGSPQVSAYGRRVSAAYREAVADGKYPLPVALESFDSSYERGEVRAPPDEIKAPALVFPMPSMLY